MPADQDRWDLLRQYILFGLGVAVILDETFTSGARPPLIVAGLILVGLVPVDMLLFRLGVMAAQMRRRHVLLTWLVIAVGAGCLAELIYVVCRWIDTARLTEKHEVASKLLRSQQRAS